jgi:hypothetical protein
MGRCQGLADALARRVGDEREVVADTLLDEKSDLYGPIDRLRGEIEFRYAIVLPLNALIVLLAVEAHVLWLLAFLASLGLYRQGGRLQLDRNRRISAALTTKPTRAPSLNRIQRALTTMGERQRDENLTPA